MCMIVCGIQPFVANKPFLILSYLDEDKCMMVNNERGNIERNNLQVELIRCRKKLNAWLVDHK